MESLGTAVLIAGSDVTYEQRKPVRARVAPLRQIVDIQLLRPSERAEHPVGSIYRADGSLPREGRLVGTLLSAHA